MGVDHYLGRKTATGFCVCVCQYSSFLPWDNTAPNKKKLGWEKQTAAKTFDATTLICREYKKIQLSLVPRTVPVVMKTLHRAEKLLKDELPEGDKSLGVLRGRRR